MTNPAFLRFALHHWPNSSDDEREVEPYDSGMEDLEGTSVASCEIFREDASQLKRATPKIAAIFADTFIKEDEAPRSPAEFINLECMLFSDNDSCLGTHVENSFALCAKGVRGKKNYLAMAVFDEAEPDLILKKVWNKFLQARCRLSSIEFYLVGGAFPVPGGSHNLSTDREIKIVSLFDKYPIRGARFHLTNEERFSKVIFCKEGIYIKRNAEVIPVISNFELLTTVYEPLFENAHIQQHFGTLPDMFQVPMDCCAIRRAPKGENVYLGTKEVSCGIAICARGMSEDSTFVGIVHLNEKGPQGGLKSLWYGLKSRGCEESSIHFYLVGGTEEETFEEQKRFLKLSSVYPIVGVKFNLITLVDEPLSVAISANRVYYGGPDLFNNF